MSKTSKPTVGLVDGDLLVFSVCAAAEYGKDEDEINTALFRSITKSIDAKLKTIINRLDLRELRVFLSHDTNFRHALMPEYKENRKGVWRPEFLKDAKGHVTDWWDAEIQIGLEADDLMAYEQVVAEPNSTIIITIDKDLLQVSGHHYRWETVHTGEKLIYVDGFGELRLEIKVDTKGKEKKEVKGNGKKFFLWQCLTGDSTDGIMGCGKHVTQKYKSGKKVGQEYKKRLGIGAIAAFELLDKTTSYEEGLVIIQEQYEKQFGKEWVSHLEKQAGCLWMVDEVIEGNDADYPVMWSNTSTRRAYHPQTNTIRELRA